MTRQLQEQHGYVLVHPFDDPLVMAGQGTAGLEIIDALPDVKTVLAPVGGGGLISGVAVAVKSRNPAVRVIGVEPQGANDAYRSLRAGRIVTIDRPDTVADGLRSQHVGDLTYQAIRGYVDDIVLVSDDEILETVRLLAEKEKLIVEPSGAVPAAALRLGRAGHIDGPAVAILSGGNIDPALLRSLL
jgi:threonine dehydratase